MTTCLIRLVGCHNLMALAFQELILILLCRNVTCIGALSESKILDIRPTYIKVVGISTTLVITVTVLHVMLYA